MNDRNHRDLYICRCEEVTLGEIDDAIAAGASTVQEVRRRTRAGMGLCQGRTCGRIVAQIISRRTGRPMEEITPAACRPPVRTVTLGEMGGDEP
ncbi:MAG: (2Fe-2S)-binding protein [Deltaproteobacteria bacterium]|nr:(2Fe-2S)-binding protein [Deltaproteobacteria bacterium]